MQHTDVARTVLLLQLQPFKSFPSLVKSNPNFLQDSADASRIVTHPPLRWCSGHTGLSPAKPFLTSRPWHWQFPLPGMLSAHLCKWSSFGISGAQRGVTCSERPSPRLLYRERCLPPLIAPLMSPVTICNYCVPTVFRVCLPSLDSTRVRIPSTGCWLKSLCRP